MSNSSCMLPFTLVVVVLLQCTFAAFGPTNITTDQNALLALKDSITNDPQNLLANNWTMTTSVCNWVGVTCGTRHRRVRSLRLSNMGLTGPIPPHLGNLSFLVFASFYNNSFHGSLPDELAKLRRLKYLSLQRNYLGLGGEIPAWLGSFTKLQILSLANNSFTGVIPPSLFNLSGLEGLDLSQNDLQGRIPGVIGNLSKLRILYLSHSGLSGSIPSMVFNISSLQEVDFSGNRLSGSLPNLNMMSSLRILAFASNNLTGLLPSHLFNNLPMLEGLHLHYNLFSGQIPSTLFGCKNLRVLSLSYNNFEGRIPKNIRNLTSLKQLYLGFNNFGDEETLSSIISDHLLNLEFLSLRKCGLAGSIPSAIGNLTLLRHLDLAENNVTGTIPPEIGNLVNLGTVLLAQNRIDGPIPFTIFNVSTLRLINLSGNDLSGHLPSNTDLQLSNLQTLDLRRNKLSGPLPGSLSNASQLIRIALTSNSFSGPIPDSLGALRKLESLELAFNNFSSKSESSELSILSSLSNCKNLGSLILSYNPLKGTLPVSVGNFSSLESFLADSCKIEGSIPLGISNLDNLIILSLEENELMGAIPATIGKLKKLQVLSLALNSLEGSIPSEICILERLSYLYLGGNKLVGSIPSCLGNVTSLRTISLASNNLTSIIPSTLWTLEYILELELASNSLTGSISSDISNLKVVTYLDISGNQLSDGIPSSFGDLKDLVSLFLSNNRLQGPIPPAFGGMVSLEILDLSRNNLSGRIPKDLEKLSYLKYLNVSFNKLEGEIPDGGPFRNLSAPSFMGNEALCGSPRMQVQPCKSSNPHQLKKASTATVFKFVLLATGATILAMALTLIAIRCQRRKGRQRIQGHLPDLAAWRRISFQEIERATNGFDEINLLGTGSFGSVYKGSLSDGTSVAIKVFNLQLEGAFKSFHAECEVLRGIRHRNLVKIITSCCNIDFKALVLEFMPKWSLEKWLYSHNYFLDLLQMLNIMIDVASALEYLHHGHQTLVVVHCDLKPSNILLDEDMVAHLSDFGIAKLVGDSQSIIQTMTLATVGYMAPEYGSEGIVSVNGDVYSYGILLMEAFTRRKPTDDMFTEEMDMKHWVKESLPSAVTQVADANLLRRNQQHFAAKKDCLSSVLELALQCSAEQPEERVDIKDALTTLNKIKAKFLKDVDNGVRNFI